MGTPQQRRKNHLEPMIPDGETVFEPLHHAAKWNLPFIAADLLLIKTKVLLIKHSKVANVRKRFDGCEVSCEQVGPAHRRIKSPMNYAVALKNIAGAIVPEGVRVIPVHIGFWNGKLFLKGEKML
jgi:hypothetical protein